MSAGVDAPRPGKRQHAEEQATAAQQACDLDALAVLFAALGFMIPVSAGVQDGGTILLSLGFNLGAALGATFSIVRRLREAFWLSLGLLVVARENSRTACPEAS